MGFGEVEHQPPTKASPVLDALASLHPHQGDFGKKGEYCSKGCVKSSFRRAASIRTTFGGWPIVLTAIFQAQSGWSRDLVRGQHAVAHWIRPMAFSMALADMGDPLESSSKSSMTW